jgi:DNA-binding transcriptional ArsR family regulator
MAQQRKRDRGSGRRKKGGDPAAAVRKAQILKALAHPARVMIFEAVAERELTVGDLAALLGAKESITSRHLAVMRAAGLVAARKEGLNVYYSSTMSCLSAVMPCLEQAVCIMADEQGRIASGLRRERRI